MSYKSFLEVVKACDKFPYELDATSEDIIHHPTPFFIDTYKVGNVLPDVFRALKAYNCQQAEMPFVVSESQITFSSWVKTREQRTSIFKELMDTWRKEKTFSVLEGWRNELYPVYGGSSTRSEDNVAFVIERASASLFGISTFGVHLNAFTKDSNGKILMWVARRALTKPTWPGLLDNCVAGGISYTYGVKDTIIKECEEEASIPEEVSSKARSVSCITYYTCTEGCLQPETQYIFDLELTQEFKPTPKDGEVECFYLWSLDKVKESILNKEWKSNCALVAIEFMIRHSYITPDEEPDYIDILYHLHRKLEFPTPRKGLHK